MRTEKIIEEKKLPAGVKFDSSLNGKYENDPYFKKKLDQANEFLRKHGVPDELKNRQKK